MEKKLYLYILYSFSSDLHMAELLFFNKRILYLNLNLCIALRNDVFQTQASRHSADTESFVSLMIFDIVRGFLISEHFIIFARTLRNGSSGSIRRKRIWKARTPTSHYVDVKCSSYPPPRRKSISPVCCASRVINTARTIVAKNGERARSRIVSALGPRRTRACACDGVAFK